MSRGTLRIGFVGAGMISQYHLQGWTETKGAEVVAICDPDLEKARRRAETFGIASVFSDPRCLRWRISRPSILRPSWHPCVPSDAGCRSRCSCHVPKADNADNARSV